MKWSDVKLWQFNKLQELSKIENEEERMIEVAEVLLGENVLDLSVAEFAKKMKELNFLKEPIPSNVPPKKITINGVKYYIDCLLGNLTTAQYVDYTNHCKTMDMCKMLSVFVIPEGHKYNDGYNIMKVMKDIEEFPITVVNDMAFFFGKHYSVFMRTLQSYSEKQIKKTKMPKEIEKNLLKMVENSVDLALYPLSSNSVK